MHHSSRLHLTRDTINSHVCQAELQSATQPLTRFSSSEYIRALNSQVQRFNDKQVEVPERRLYMIDKLVRLRAKEAKFGFDHSEVLNLERELLEPFMVGTNTLKPEPTEGVNDAQFSKQLFDKLSKTVPGTHSPQLKFDEWKRKKEAEMRLKTKLIEDAIQQEVQKRIAEDEVRERHTEESQQKIAEWNYQKQIEAKRKALKQEENRRAEQEHKDKQKAKAEEQFKEWLRDNFMKLKEQKRMEKAEHRSEELRAVERQRLEEERKWLCEQQFQAWVRRKASVMNNRSTSSMLSKPSKAKKPIMLAYSPNRRLKTSSSPTSMDNPSKYTTSEIDVIPEPSSTEEVKTSQSSTSSKRLKRVKKTVKKGKTKRADDVQPIDELSSIQRTSHQGGHFASGEEDVEGFIYSGNEDESNEE